MLKILDLFAGAGGLSLGFEETEQFEVAAIVENNKNAAKTYIRNHPGLKNYEDILTVDFNKIKAECGEIDVIIGGPPCQGFSNANRQRRQLINGSNELVKKYVEAISVLKPKAFVMENVKTIASDKHSFCVTNGDKKHITEELKLPIHKKSIVLYEGDLTNQIYNLAQKYKGNIHEVVLLSEDELYFLYNLCKKHNSIKHLLSKQANVKELNAIAKKLKKRLDMPSWYNVSMREVKQVIVQLLTNCDEVEENWWYKVKKFWDIHRFFMGLDELERKDAIHTYSVVNRAISVQMDTYIVIDYIRASFEYLKYQVNGDVLNAAEYGVPQTRERFILIGARRDIYDKEIMLPAPIIDNVEDFVTVEEAIGDLYSIAPTTESMDETQKKQRATEINTYYRNLVMTENYKDIHNHVCTATRETALERFAQIEPGGNFHSLPDSLKSSYENPDRTQNTVYKRLDPKLPSDTVVNVRKSMWIHPEYNRAVSAREAARLQSFPDSYIFYGTKDSVYQQIGNAVPPVLGRAVAEEVLKIFNVTDKKFVSLRSIYKKYNK